ncbi:uncharacterized protein Tco_0658321 [Tanacetum coccineum]
MLPNLEGNAAEKNHDQSQQLFVDSETPLYEVCEDFTKLSATYRLMNVKAINGWSDTGPKQPVNDIDIYLKPLIKHMQDIWSKGVEGYDAYKKETIQMQAMIFCTISDFPAYGNLSRYKTKGKMACPVCQDHTHSIWLAKCKKPVYMGHRRSLQENHPYRKKRKLFDNNIEVNKLPPPLNGHATFSQVEDIHIVFGKGKEGTSTLKERKTKDAVKVRKDMEAMKITPELAPREIVGKTSTYLPPACYTMSKAEKTKFCQWLSEIKVPSGYSANIKKLVSMQDLKLFGMKSQDCHVIDPELLDQWQRDTILTICELEMYFPPSLFDVMVHLVSHIVREIKTCGPTEGSIIEGYATEEAIEFYTDYSNRVKTVGITQSRHEGRLHREGTLGRQDFSPNIDDLREAHFTVLQHMTCIAPYIYEHKYTFYTKEQDDKSTLQNSGVTLIASTTELSTVNREERSKNAKKAYYGVIQEIWELHYNSTVIPLFKCKWVDNEKGVDVDEDGFTTVNLSTNGYKSEPFMKMVSVQIAVGSNTWTMAKDQFLLSCSLDKAIKIVECRRVLNWSYAFSYLLPDEEDTKTNLFNYLQGVQGFDQSFEEVVYPKGKIDAVFIGKRDVDMLLPDTFVNDTIIDFYIKYLKSKITHEDRLRFHFRNSFFVRKLADPDKEPLDACKRMEAFQCVRKWTRKLNLLEKDYIFIPVNYKEVATYQDEDVTKLSKVPCVLHMDPI